ncbi:MAG: B12-binding domain-containing radical SAM protein [Desulfobulbus sp.]|nr:MAG: B12-binding domain-containing radical SAM protein [Desulfobulbus sp.]
MKKLHIAMIAMSGIRACDTELLEMGLTLPGFVERSKVIASLPSLGLLTLAGMTPEHHTITYFEVESLNDSPPMTQLADCDLVAISSLSAQIKDAYKLADRICAQSIPVVMGGLHVSAVPEEAARHCDSVVVGEGEPQWLKVLADAANNSLQRFYVSDGSFNLDDTPMPAFELLDIEKYNRITVQTSRGCPHRCEFCASSVMLTSRYKQKPMDRVLAEVDKICSIWARPFIELADDNSFVNRDYWKKLLPLLAQKNIRWFTETDISIAKDQELLQLLHASGCVQVLIGLESPDAQGLRGLETKQNWKARQQPDYARSIQTIQSHGISVNGCFILGMDNHDPEIFDNVYRFVNQTKLHEVQITIQTPFPGTPLYQRLAHENRILSPHAWEKCTLFDVNFKPLNMSARELASQFRELTARLYSKESTDKRKQLFREQIRAAYRKKTDGTAPMAPQSSPA